MFCAAGKDGKIYVFRLLDFEGETADSLVRSKPDCKEHKIEKTKGESYSGSALLSLTEHSVLVYLT